MAFRLFSVFITVLTCLNFGEVKSWPPLDCATWCSKEDCDRENINHYKEQCRDAKSKCDCTAALFGQLKELIKDSVKFNQLLGLVLGATFFIVIVGIVGCCLINNQMKQLIQNTGGPGGPGGPGGAMYQPSPSRVNYGYQPGGPQPSPYANPSGAGPNPSTYNKPYPTGPLYNPPNAVNAGP